jgi:hypothetical protein
MKPRIGVILLVSHLSIGALGFGLGIYLLPILIAPPSPADEQVLELSSQATYEATFHKDLKDSDAFHWGEGKVSINDKHISFKGELAPGPDYKLYLSGKYLETEDEFELNQSSMVLVGDVKTFNNFVVDVSPEIDISAYNTVIVWCETFGEFITAAQYR